MEVQVFNGKEWETLSEKQFKDYYYTYVYCEKTNNYAGQHIGFLHNRCAISLYSHYDFCCGLREIGDISIPSSTDVSEFREKFISLVESNIVFKNVGALTYTRTKDRNNINLQDDTVVEFIEEWPGASKGHWFFNPNSGNMVQQWTLPINQSKQHDYDDDCEEEDGE